MVTERVITVNRIRDLRTDADLKQEELAEKIGISQKSLSRYKTEQTIIDAETLKKYLYILMFLWTI